MEISIFAAFWCLKVAEIWDVIVLNNKVNIFTEMLNQVSISIQNLNGPEKTIFGLFIISNNHTNSESFTI